MSRYALLSGALALATIVSSPVHAGCPRNLVPPPGIVHTLVVVNTNDAGPGSLRAALSAANGWGHTVIGIAPALCGQTVDLQSPLPPVTADQVLLVGCPIGSELVLTPAAPFAGAGLELASSDDYVCGLALEGFAGAGLLVSQGQRNELAGNVVVGNCLAADGLPCAGIGVVGGAGHIVSGNIVGPAGTGLGAPNAGDGILVAAVKTAILSHNLVGENDGDGVHLIANGRVELYANVIGVGPLGGDAGNAGAGVRMDGGGHVIGRIGDGNNIGFNGAHGVEVAAFGADPYGPRIAGNHIHDNDGHGIEIDAGVISSVIEGNTIELNGDLGIHLAATSEATRLADNRVLDNATCAIRLERGANGDLQAPVVTNVEDDNGTFWIISGYAVAPVFPSTGSEGEQGVRLGDGTIDLYWGDGPGRETAHHLTSFAVTADQTTWEVSVGHSRMPPGAFVVATFTDAASGATTALSERCDGFDQNCDGLADEAFDWDADGFSTCGAGMTGVPSGVDCDDAVAATNPADHDGDGYSMCTSPEDFYDNDAALRDDADGDGTPADSDCCDGDAGKSCLDRDGDGYVTCPAACGNQVCKPTSVGYCKRGGNDPDDTNAAVVPVAELCNGLDDDNDGRTDETFDADGDGYTTCGLGRVDGTAGGADCDDDDALVHPGAVERCDNGVDDDCDRALPVDEDTDADRDGLRAGCVGWGGPIDDDDRAPRGGGHDDDRDGAPASVDCDDHDPAMNLIDYDRDGVSTCSGDCDDSDASDLDCSRPRWLARNHDVVVDRATGAITPRWVFAHAGDQVTWHFAAPDGTYVYDTVVPVAWTGASPDLCDAAASHDALGDDDFSGPERGFVPGPAVISSEDYGLVEEDVGPGACCAPGVASASANGKQLCRSGDLFETMAGTWSDPNVGTVSLRLLWDGLEPEPGRFDFSRLDRELDQAVANGKSVSLGIAAGKHGTPEWIFSTGCTEVDGSVVTDELGAARSGVERLTFQDSGDSLAGDKCGSTMDLGSPTDPMFQCHYFAMLRAVAAHIRSRAAWFAAVGQVKITGANMFTEENRMPRRCKCGCICNTYVWATARHGAYTQDRIRRFYALQEELFKTIYPGKDVSYMLIQGGLPNVVSPSVFDSCCGGCGDGDPGATCNLPTDISVDYCATDWQMNAKDATPKVDGATQVRDIIHDGIYGFTDAGGRAYANAYGDQFTVQHNGIAPIGVRTPNRYVMEWSDGERHNGIDSDGEQPSGFQTVNLHSLATPAQLQGAFESVVQQSNGLFLEIYEARLWQAKQLGRELVDPRLGPTLTDYAHELQQRVDELASDFGWDAPEAFPRDYRFTFPSRELAVPAYYPYVNGTTCHDHPDYGVIVLVPDY